MKWEDMMVRARAAAQAIMPAVVLVMAVVIVALAVLVQRNNENVERLTKSTDRVEVSTHRVSEFVDDLEQETPEEQAQNAAVTAAVQLVPEIKAILCEAFPNATACGG